MGLDWGSIGAIVGNPTGVLANIGAVANYMGQKETNQMNRDIMEGNKSWQEYMSNTAHQREVNDLREAGLNPILSANKGGASTPSPGAAVMENALGAGVNSAMDGLRLSQQMKATDSQVALNQAQGIAAAAQATNLNASAKNTELNTIKQQAEMPAIKKEAEVRAIQADYDKKNATTDAFLKRLTPAVQAGASAIGAARSIMNPLKGVPIKGGDRIPKGRGTYDKKTGEIFD